MATITGAGLLGSHPSVQDLNIATSPTTNNPTKQHHMQQFRSMNALFRGDDHGSPSKRDGRNLCAPTGGPKIVALRNEDNIRKGVYVRTSSTSSDVAANIINNNNVGKRSSVVGNSIMVNNNNGVLSSSRPLAKEDGPLSRCTPTKKLAPLNMVVPPLLGNQVSSPQSLPPRSPVGGLASANNHNNNNNKHGLMSLPQLLRQAQKKRKIVGGVAVSGNKTPSEISLVTSIESRDASTNHPCSETVYSCECCRPKKPGTFGAPPISCSKHNNKTHNEDDDDDDDDDSLYDNLTSVSQRGTNQNAYKIIAEMPREQNITARQIFELQQAKAAAGGSYGHNQAKKAGGHAGGASGRNPMGFGLISQQILDHATNRGLSARTAASDVSSLTRTNLTGAANQTTAGSRVTASSSKVSSSAVRQLEQALEQERTDRLKTEEQISRIRERQERLLAKLTPLERRKMQELLEGTEDN